MARNAAPAGSPHELRSGALLVSAAAVMWALWPVWVRRGAGQATALIAFAIAGLAALPLALRESASRPRRAPRAWLWMAALGVIDAGNTFCYFRALADGAVAPAVLSHYLAPVLVALGAPLLLAEPRSRRTPLALALALGGTALLVLGRGSGAPAPAVETALVWGGLSAAFFASTVLIARHLGREFGPAELLAYHALVACAALAPVLPLGTLAIDARLAWAAAGGVVSTALAGLIYYRGLRRLPAERAGVLSYLEPLAALLVGWLVFSETPGLGAAAGGALILAGGLLVVTS